MSTKAIFDKDYFTGYYQNMTGDFSPAFLSKNMNWFYGWFQVIERVFGINFSRGKKALEFGCAIGAASRLLADKGWKVVATDISSYAVKKAEKVNQHPKIKFEKMDVETTRKYTGIFDFIFGFEVIEHLPHPEKALVNIHRMLKKNGVVICSTPYPYTYVFRDKTHVNVRHPLDWERIFTEAGFRNIKVRHISFVPFFYRFSKRLHFTFPFGLPTPYINSTIFIYAQK